jgi:multidrug efflux system membrane fusion protein
MTLQVPTQEPKPAAANPVESAPTRQPLSRRATMIGTLVALLLVASIGGLAWYLTRPATATAAGGPGAPGGGFGGGRGSGGGSTVGVATAERASIPVTLDALGTATPLATVKVRPQVSGVLEKVLFKEGQMVRVGDLLATIDARQFELALAQATGQRQRDLAQLESAKVTLARFQTLLGQDSIARQEVDSQAALVKQLEGTVMIDSAAVGVAHLNLSYTRIASPISGRVGLRTVDVGNSVSSSDANGIVVITQVMPMDVVFAIPQDRVTDVLNATDKKNQPGMQVIAMDRTRTGVLGSGMFASLDNQVDTTTGTVKAKARFANADSALFANQFVNIQLRIKSIDNAVVVPVTAVRLGGSGDYVFVLNSANRTVSIRPVVRGQAAGEKIVIASGLKAGEQVIIEGADRLKEGSKVSLAGDAPRGGGSRPGASAAQGAAAPAAGSTSPSDAPGAKSATPSPLSAVSMQPSAKPSDAPAMTNEAKAPPLPTPEQRLRMLDRLKDDPAALEERKHFFELLDKGDPDALERWKAMAQRRQGGGERPAQ